MHITYEMVRDEIPAIIDTRGEDFVYSVHAGSGGTCMYVWEGQPDCLIGCYLASKGVPLEAFADHEGSEVEKAVENGLLTDNGITADPEAIHAMSRLQYWQDDNSTWGEAYSKVFEFTN